MNPSDMVLLLLVGLPLSGGMLILALYDRKRLVQILTAFLVALTASGALVFLLTPVSNATSPSFGIKWLPNAGRMRFRVGMANLAMITVTAWSAFAVLVATPRQYRRRPAWWGTLTLIALATNNAALLSDHLLGRYFALEVIAFIISIMPFAEQRDTASMRSALTIYLILRLGDAGLLTSILLLDKAGNTLNIGVALRAAQALPATSLIGIVTGFLLSVWVKQGNWPFDTWLSKGRHLRPIAGIWLYAIVMPNLGSYLLYRVEPLLSADSILPALRVATLWLGALGMPAALFASGWSNNAPRFFMKAVGTVAAQGSLAVLLAAGGNGALVWQGALLATIPRILMFGAAYVTHNPRIAKGAFAIGGMSAAAIMGLTTWWAWRTGHYGSSMSYYAPLLIAQIAAMFTAVQSVRVFTTSIERPAVGRPGSDRHEKTRIAAVIARAARRFAQTEALDGITYRGKKLPWGTIHYSQLLHTGKLRHNLLWVAAALAIAIGALLL